MSQASRLVFVTQVIDPAHPVLGITLDLVRALGAQLDVTVIANSVSGMPEGLPAEVISLGKESGAPRSVRTARYLRAVETVTRHGLAGRAAALLAHMCPIYLTTAAPIAKPRGVRMLLWYAQAGADRWLRVAELAADAVLTSMPGAYPGRSGTKLVPIGQAIDTTRFAFTPRQRSGALQLLAIGRTAAVKRYEVAIRAVAEVRGAGEDVRLTILGPSTTPGEVAERARLATLIEQLGLEEAVQLGGPLPREQVPAAIAGCDALVNVTASGSADKSAFEAMAVGRPVLTANATLATLVDHLALPLHVPGPTARDLEGAIRALVHAAPGVANQVGWELHQRVLASHSLEHWAAQVAGQASGLAPGTASPLHSWGR
ncbi:MAG TPA: glycosyltransferase family 4 protein [Actinomycetota bacterium]|nr:glycosyltransferase family 4 protein [Actinomycetota bacterium]